MLAKDSQRACRPEKVTHTVNVYNHSVQLSWLYQNDNRVVTLPAYARSL